MKVDRGVIAGEDSKVTVLGNHEDHTPWKTLAEFESRLVPFSER